MREWFVQQLRFSAFSPSATPELLSNIWPLISVNSPESDESRPREGFRRMAAPEGEFVLEIVTQPGRFDIVESAAPTLAGIQPIIHFGQAEPQLTAFSTRVHSLFDGLGDSIKLQRLALGIVLVRPVANRETAYQELGKLLSINLDPGRSRDFLFQINYPEVFNYNKGSIELNRLSRWSAMRSQHFMLQVAQNAAGEPVPARTELAVGETFIRCEIDNSSAAENFETLSRDSWQTIFDKLIELAMVTASGEPREAS